MATKEMQKQRTWARIMDCIPSVVWIMTKNTSRLTPVRMSGTAAGVTTRKEEPGSGNDGSRATSRYCADDDRNQGDRHCDDERVPGGGQGGLVAQELFVPVQGEACPAGVEP